ncbi:hypothetical protein Pcinc_022511 [Petrolisthes cinctipes]|uniref:Uncharacterized protein n=1 Tax=Petrolisthes cinctipes TaxID=88211 RepID=A0AAE1FEX5_PETCI|nr:hypothetical protein Pcinc_022511 [Petrolisthes cinctipes]
MRFSRNNKNTIHELIRREYGVKCSWWTSMQALRRVAFGPRRRWVKVYQTKESSLLEMSGDLMWVTQATDRTNGTSNTMLRILGDGRIMTVYTMQHFPRAKEVEIYEIPHPVYTSSLPHKEYQPVMFLLRKGGLLTRHHLETGEVYDQLSLGNSLVKTISVNFVSDVLVAKSSRLYRPGEAARGGDGFFKFFVFTLHPFTPLACFSIHTAVFPGTDDRVRYGKMRNAEIHDGLLLIMTDKNFTLLYNADVIIEANREKEMVCGEWIQGVEGMVKETPPLLFATYTHMDILGLGGCPWAYLTALSDAMIVVRDLKTDEVMVDGRVCWEEGGIQQISPDYLMFHPDDSSRLIHVRTHQIRVLAIREKNGKRCLQEEFTYPEKDNEGQEVREAQYSRSGRRLMTKFKWDDSLNTALSFNVEADLRLLVIMEARRDLEQNCTRLLRVLFYDSHTYQRLHIEPVDVWVDGDIETNRLSVSIDRDILNVVSHMGTVHTILSFRLQEVFDCPGDEEWRDQSTQNDKKLGL